MLAVKDYVRDALLTVALFGSIGAARAQTPPASSPFTSFTSPSPRSSRREVRDEWFSKLGRRVSRREPLTPTLSL